MQNPTRALLRSVIGAPCPYCGAPMILPGRPPTRDHIEPRVRGFTLADPSNRALVCDPCNQDKGARSLTAWLETLRTAGDPRAEHVAAFIERRDSP